MNSCRLLVSITLVVILAISYELFSGMGVNARDVITEDCGDFCIAAHKDGYKIYGYPSSTNTRRALAVLHEKNISYVPITVDLKSGEQKKPRFLAINPFGQVPVLVDGNFKLTQSRAISEYIATVHSSSGSQLLNNKSNKTMAIQKMWMGIESFEFDPPTSILMFEQYFKPMLGLKTDFKVVNETEAKLEKVLDIYEGRLKTSTFLASNSFTLADLYHLPNLQYLLETPSRRLFKNRPSVNRWVTEILARPAWKKACDEKAWYGKGKN